MVNAMGKPKVRELLTRAKDFAASLSSLAREAGTRLFQRLVASAVDGISMHHRLLGNRTTLFLCRDRRAMR